MLLLTILAAVLGSQRIISILAHPTSDHVNVYTSRAVTNSSKAGLGWENAANIDLTQYLTTGKVSWCVNVHFSRNW